MFVTILSKIPSTSPTFFPREDLPLTSSSSSTLRSPTSLNRPNKTEARTEVHRAMAQVPATLNPSCCQTNFYDKVIYLSSPLWLT